MKALHKLSVAAIGLTLAAAASVLYAQASGLTRVD